MSQKSLRNIWMVTHRWIGIIGLAAMFLLAVSGCFLVWPDASERLMHGDRFKASAAFDEARLEEYVESARTGLPDGDRISAMSVPPAGSDRSILTGGRPYESGRVGPPPRHRTWIDPGSADVTSTWGLAPDGMWIMHATHGHLIFPGFGRTLVGIFGFILLFSVFTGAWLWWPRNGKILKALRWKRAPDFISNLHHMVGFWSIIPQAVLAFTGAYIVFPAMFGAVVLLVTGNLGGDTGGHDHETAPPITAPAETTQYAASEAVSIAREAGGAGDLTFIAWPTESNPVWMVQFNCRGAESDCAHAVRVNDESGATVIPVEEHDDTIATEVADLMMEVHAGGVGGPIWQIIVFLSGIVLALLSVSGIIMWAQKRGGRVRVKKLRMQRA